MAKRISLLFLCVAFGVSAYILLDRWQYEKMTPIKKMQRLWEEDVQAMQESHQLPAQWNSIREIELTPGDDVSKEWLKNLQVPVVVKKDGAFRLQVMLVPWEENGKQGALMQYDLVDLNSLNSNTVWETSRTFILSDNESWLSEIEDEWPVTGKKEVKK